ncbi:uncharacterized protein LOC117324394 [Pecten maximus]|uniref:uncharacterized protein LOC117324394 n=1 Tax=Pecten maximus TaxID=6579 RepID=UPI0014587450|nr:uncharacterized protein LOC117324394 [Pecten maximus]
MLRIIQKSRVQQGVRAVTNSMFSTSSTAAKSASEAPLPEVPSYNSMNELAQAAKFGMVPSKGRYAKYVIGEQKRCLQWKWENPDGCVHQSSRFEDRLMYSILGFLIFYSVLEYWGATAMKTNAIKYNRKSS